MAKVYLFILGLMFVSAVFSKHDEWYCKVGEDKYEICRKCKTLDENCDEEAPADCKCENLKFANLDYKLYGGPKTCETNDPFCFVTENSNCDDAKHSTVNDRLENIWLNPEVYYSYEACESDNQDDNTGNEAILEGVKITGDSEDLEFYFKTSDECRKACKSRIGQCGSWSFDKTEKICNLHSVDSCCGQFGKRETNSGFTSGYTCQYCWSTKANKDCPCSLKERSQKPGIAHASGADSQCTGEIELKNLRSRRRPKIIKRKGKYWGDTKEWEIPRNSERDNLKTRKATLKDGNCCWTITGTRNQEISMNHNNVEEQLNFYVRKLKAHKCTEW